jgi:G3E family GTPase
MTVTAQAGAEPIGVFLLTGFLGSGKTSLIRRLIAHPEFSDTALIINEFGEVGLDQLFVKSAVENTLLLENGCVCCSVRGDLIDTISELFVRVDLGSVPPFSRIVIETTGIADPGPIVTTLQQTAWKGRSIALHKVIVTIDGLLGLQQLRTTEEAPAQIAQADLCLVTKVEQADQNAVNQLIGELHALNPAAEVEQLYVDRLNPQHILTRASARAFPKPDKPRAYRLKIRPQVRTSRHGQVNTWSIELGEPIVWHRFRDWLDLLYSLRSAQLLRMKAILNLTGEAAPVVVHGVGPLVGEREFLDNWPGDDVQSRIVVITKNMDPQVVGQSFAALVAPASNALDKGGAKAPPERLLQ